MSSRQDWAKPGYHAFVRRDIAPLLPPHAEHVLDVGCSQGGTLAWLRDSGVAAHTTGIEIDPAAARIARDRVDHLIEGDVDAALSHAGGDVVRPRALPRRARAPGRPVAHRGAAGRDDAARRHADRERAQRPPLQRRRCRCSGRDAGSTRTPAFSIAPTCASSPAPARRRCWPAPASTRPASIDTGVEPTRRRELWKPVLARTAWRDLGVFQFVMAGRKPVAAAAPAAPARAPALAAAQ